VGICNWQKIYITRNTVEGVSNRVEILQEIWHSIEGGSIHMKFTMMGLGGKTKVVSSNYTHGEVYSIQHYVI
jgi:hypothetical protein